MAVGFDITKMTEALDRLALEVVRRGVKLDIAVYGGSALMLASNFRYASEDVDARLVTGDFPEWLKEAVARIGAELGMEEDWLNDHVLFHLSRIATDAEDHVFFGTFPRGSQVIGLRILVPTAEYMLALKLKAMRVADPTKGRQETADIVNLMKVVGCSSPEHAIEILGKFFPMSAQSPEKQLFLLRHLSDEDQADAPAYPVRGL